MHESFRRIVSSAALIGLAAALLAGLPACTTNSSNQDDPTTRALSDPMGYHGDPNADDKYNISGGGLTNFDSAAFKRDMDNVLNP
jgi:hypothetical protein